MTTARVTATLDTRVTIAAYRLIIAVALHAHKAHASHLRMPSGKSLSKNIYKELYVLPIE